MIVDNEEVVFMRNDGSIVDDKHVGLGGKGDNGELLFFEIKDLFRPKLKGKNKYARIAIQQVYPYIKRGEE